MKMNQNLRMLPVYLMLFAGATTSIITYALHYEGKTALLILLGVLLFFYIFGSMFVQMIFRFEKEQEEKERIRLEEEGKVLEKEKEAGTEQNEKTASETETAKSAKDSE